MIMRCKLSALLPLFLLPFAKVELVSAQPSSSFNEDVIAYWTPERRENAEPMVLEHEGGTVITRRRLSVANADWPELNLPWQVSVGALFFYNTLTQKNSRCSGTVIKDGKDDRSLVLTAAHCLCQGKKWFNKFYFVPEWEAGGTGVATRKPKCEDEKYGCWVGQVALVEERYVELADPKATWLVVPYDYGVLVVANRQSHSPGETAVDPKLDVAITAVEVDTTTSYLPDKPFNFIGYPQSHAPNLRYCEDSNKIELLFGQPVRLVPKCRLNKGASGGPGIPADVDHANAKVHSVISTRSDTGNRGPFLNGFFPCLLEKAKGVPLWKGTPYAWPPGWKEGHVAHNPIGPAECGLKGKVVNDPHFETWTGRWYDFMGGCDLVFLRAPHFGSDHSLDINIRTKVRESYSYIQNAAIKIKDDILEVDSFGDYFVNGVSGARMPRTIGGYSVTHSKPTKHINLFEIHLGGNETIAVRAIKDMVSVMLDKAAPHRFRDSHGMLGDHATGFLMARDGTIMNQNDPNALAAEWQVRDDEPMLFQSVEEPQYPQKCVLPDPALKDERERRLGSSISREDAEIACAEWSEQTKENCIFDVMATGDLDMASVGAY